MRRSTTIGAAVALLAGLAPAAVAQPPGEVRITDENDSWFNPFPSRTDRYYTQGLRVEWLQSGRKSDADFLPGISHADWCSLICGAGFRSGQVNTGYALGQNMYTPEDISVAAPQPNDRPWAGMLYVSRIARISYDEPALRAQRQDRIEISLGIVGPASLAGDTQILFHEIIDGGRPAGWRNQLRNEPILQMRYEAALRWPRQDGGNADIIPRVRANLGNALISLEADVTARIGWNLSGFGVQAPQPFAPAASAMASGTSSLTGSRWLGSGNLFLRGGLKAVAHNITLDGNSFGDNDIRIRRKAFVPELGIGFEVNLVGNVWLTYQFVHRGSEFERRNGRDAPAQEFGSVTLAWTFGGE